MKNILEIYIIIMLQEVLVQFVLLKKTLIQITT